MPPKSNAKLLYPLSGSVPPPSRWKMNGPTFYFLALHFSGISFLTHQLSTPPLRWWDPIGYGQFLVLQKKLTPRIYSQYPPPESPLPIGFLSHAGLWLACPLALVLVPQMNTVFRLWHLGPPMRENKVREIDKTTARGYKPPCIHKLEIGVTTFLE